MPTVKLTKTGADELSGFWSTSEALSEAIKLLERKLQMGTEIEVGRLPDCDLGPGSMGFGPDCPNEARYDFKTKMGPWAFGCEKHWRQYRASAKLGTGLGQKLVRGKEML